MARGDFMPKGNRGGKRSGGLPFKNEAQAEVYASQQLKKSGVSRYGDLPGHGVTSKRAKNVALSASSDISNGHKPRDSNFSKKTARDALKIAQHDRLALHRSFLSVHGPSYDQYKKLLSDSDKTINFFKSKL